LIDSPLDNNKNHLLLIEDEPALEAFHCVLTTHNSRTSARMRKYNVKKEPSLRLRLHEEIALTRIIGKIIQESGYRCISFNICIDHVHIILVCSPEKLTAQIQKIKSVSSKEFHRLNIPMGHDPLKHKGHLWSQKFYRATLDVWELNTVTRRPGFIYNDCYLQNAMDYIQNNRHKHGLIISEELEQAILDFIMNEEEAFSVDLDKKTRL
jgi:REP element-mobilizing transposase RayT